MKDILQDLYFDTNSKDWVEDCTKEISYVCSCNNQQAKTMIDELVNYDNLCKQRNMSITEYLKECNVPAEYMYILMNVTTPLRIPGLAKLPAITEVLSFIEQKTTAKYNGKMLDYGGGGGRDAIAFGKNGLDTTLLETKSFITSPNHKPLVEKRFNARNLKVRFVAPGELDEKEQFDYVHCMDVLEHCYDVEFILCDMTRYLKKDGILFVNGDFDNVAFNGDHLEKNRFYSRSNIWLQLMKSIGYELMAYRPNETSVEIWKLKEKLFQKMEDILILAYRTTRKHAISHLIKSFFSIFYSLRDFESLKIFMNGNTRGNKIQHFKYRRGLPLIRSLQNLSDSFHVLELASERLRNLEK